MRRLFQFRLLSMLVILSAFGIVLAIWVRYAEKQRRAVEFLRGSGGFVRYDFEESGFSSPKPFWLSDVVGIDYLSAPVSLWLSKDATDADLLHVGQLRHLHTLVLDGSNVSDVGVHHISEVTNLVVLGLDRTRVGDHGMDQLSGLVNLEVLSIRGTRITDDGLAVVRNFPSIQGLFLDETHVSDKALRYLGALEKLEELSLVGTDVTDDGIGAIAAIRCLKMVDVTDTHVTDKGINELQRLLPQCAVIR